MSLNRISNVCWKTGMVALAAAMLAWSAPTARAGAIRYAGKMVVKGTTAAVAATTSGGQAAADEVQSAGQETGRAGSSFKRVLVHMARATTNGAKDGGAAVYYGAKRTPHEVAHGARSVWRAVW